MKTQFFILSIGVSLLLCSCSNDKNEKPATLTENKVEKIEDIPGTVMSLTNESFKQKVFNYEINKEWKFEGNLPVIIDFYADWCRPCKMLSPLVEEIAKKYAGKIVVYKVNTDAEQQLAQAMGVSSLPTLLFIPVNGQPQSSMGALPIEELERAVKEVLLVH